MRYLGCTVMSKLSIANSAWRTSTLGNFTPVSLPKSPTHHTLLTRFFNKTEYSGLETHILHSYTNALLQAMHYIEPIRQLAKSHITTNCQREHCLLCELGFVVRMLEDAHGTNCQASNFCKTVGMLAQGSFPASSSSFGVLTFSRRELNRTHRLRPRFQ